VLGQREDVAVIQVQPERLGVELVGEPAAGRNGFVYPVHVAGVDPVEVHGVGVAGGVEEVDPNPVALDRAEGGAGHAAVVCPGLVIHPGHDFDRLHACEHVVLAQHPPVWQGADLAVVEVGQDIGRVEAVGLVVDIAHGHGHEQAVVPGMLDAGGQDDAAGGHRLGRHDARSERPDGSDGAHSTQAQLEKLSAGKRREGIH
jgi:hypothetical protein